MFAHGPKQWSPLLGLLPLLWLHPSASTWFLDLHVSISFDQDKLYIYCVR